jgi:hypothetical protein
MRLFAASLWIVVVLTGSAADWPQFLGPNRNGSITESNLAQAWPKDGPTVVWNKNVGQGFAGPMTKYLSAISLGPISSRPICPIVSAPLRLCVKSSSFRGQTLPGVKTLARATKRRF